MDIRNKIAIELEKMFNQYSEGKQNLNALIKFIDDAGEAITKFEDLQQRLSQPRIGTK
jgi:type II restriction/modification system DNA methylase subunit YeeA